VSDFKPQVVGPYLLIEKIASGGMAEVYRARFTRDAGFEKEVAIKRILPNYTTNPEFKSMFEHEARLCSDLNHANIVQVKDFQRIGDTYLLEMEYVDGKNLRQLINKAQKIGIQLPMPFGIYVINEVTKGLEYAHTKKDKYTGASLNIIHRDISPQNIMVSYDGQVKIVDFGIAKAKNRVDETRSGVIKGKFGYMSPEQAHGYEIDKRSDIFSISIILYELVTGKRLFSAENDMATLKLIQQCVIPQPSRVNPKISTELEKIILKGLSADLSLRYQSAGELGKVLQLYLNKHYPEYSQKDVIELVQKIFKSEIESEKRRLREISRQSIPYSNAEIERPASPNLNLDLDGDITKSEIVENESDTSIDESNLDNKANSLNSELSDLATVVDSQSFSFEDSELNSLIEKEEIPNTASRGSVAGNLIDKSFENTESDENTINDIDVVSKEDGQYNEEISLNQNSLNILDNSSLTEQNSAYEPEQVDNSPLPENIYTDYVPRKKRFKLGKLILFGALVSVVIYLYKFYTEGRLIAFLPKIEKIFGIPEITTDVKAKLEPREITTDDKAKSENSRKTKKIALDCTLIVETEPPGATIIFNGKEIGTTPLPISSSCGKNIHFKIQKEFYKTVEKNVLLEPQKEPIYVQLEKIQTGTLKLTLNYPAKVYVDGNPNPNYIAQANEEFELIVTAKDSHTLRFVNDVYHINYSQKFKVAPDSISEHKIILENK